MLSWPLQIADYLADPKTAGVIDAVALLLTIVGFSITIVQVRKSKTAAQSAAEAVGTVLNQIGRFDAAAECATAIQILEEIERLHRTGPIHMLPDRYNAVRKALISIRAANLNPVNTHMTSLQDAIAQLATLRDTADRLIAQGASSVDTVKSNRITRRIVDTLTELTAALRNQAVKV